MIGSCAELSFTQIDSEFDEDDKVWVKNPASGSFDWAMFVVRKVDDSSRSDWAYVVRDSEENVYSLPSGESVLVPESDLRAR